MKISVDPKKTEELLSRSIAQILPSKEEFEKLLLSGKRIRIYIGADATGPALHLGHATNYIILEKFRSLGHKVIILIGDFTARIGDSTDRTAARVRLTDEQVKKNIKTWLEQLTPLLDLKNKENPPAIAYNSKWLSKLTYEDIIELASNFTVQRLLERDMYEKRLKEDKPIFFHELHYPLMQGYDSVALDVDAELFGTDQTFNALAGRLLLKRLKNKEKFVITTTLLENPITGEKMMSKSRGTGIYLNESAKDMYGKMMAQPDENIPQLFMDCTYVGTEEIAEIKKSIKSGELNPRNAKNQLAKEIVSIYHGTKAAQAAEEEFNRVFKQKELPSEMPSVKIKSGKYPILDLLVRIKLASSKAEAKRLIVQGGVKIGGIVEHDWQKEVEIFSGMVIQAGKRKFIKIETA